jgi:hypothetical protein
VNCLAYQRLANAPAPAIVPDRHIQNFTFVEDDHGTDITSNAAIAGACHKRT